MKAHPSLVSLCLLSALAAPALAQDSVPNSKIVCLPGDALSPYDATEQRNRYIVDLADIKTSWGNPFGLAPIIKSSKTSTNFFNSLFGAQGISRKQVTNQAFSGRYDFWQAAGSGINGGKFGKEQLNKAGIPFPGPAQGNQFGVAFQESGLTDKNINYTGAITGIVRYDPADSSRLFVERIVSAISGCNEDSQTATFGFGSVDANGQTVFRADDFGLAGPALCTPSLTSISKNNIYMINAAARSMTLNVISGDYPKGRFDATATNWIVRSSSTTHTTPSIADIGGVPYYVGLDFNGQYVRGTTSANVKGDKTFWGTGMASTRGNISRLNQNHPALKSTNGLAACLGRNSSSEALILNVWGLDKNGNVSGKLALTFPGSVTDAITGNKNRTVSGSKNEFDHYHSQVAFQGGNGQVAMNIDKNGDLLVCAVMDQPQDVNPDHGFHHIPVARVSWNGTKATVTWSMAAYNDSIKGTTVTGPQKILDGSGGKAIGELSNLLAVTGTTKGPSFSGPMIDSAGNILFFSAIKIFGTTDRQTTGLVRAVYNDAKKGYELELIFANGTVLTGKNSKTKYQIQFVPIADTNSVSSSTMWSQNLSENGYGGQEHLGVPNSSPLHVGGLVFNARITYDMDGDGKFASCRTTTTSKDQDYQALMYLGSRLDCAQDLGSYGPGKAVLTVCGQGFKQGETITGRVGGGPVNARALAYISLPGGTDLNILNGTLVSFAAPRVAEIFTGFDAKGELALNFSSLPAGSFVLQLIYLDPSTPFGVGFTNAVQINFGR